MLSSSKLLSALNMVLEILGVKVSQMSISPMNISVFMLSIALVSGFLATPSMAQEYDVSSTAATGDFGYGTAYTGDGPSGVGGNYSVPTSHQSAVMQPTCLGRLTPSIGPSGLNGLPPTVMESFVRNAGASADLIYGDEGTDGPPPYSEFTQMHRIEAGIHGRTASGLTTGHRANLPSAWGNDEFLGAEWYLQPEISYNRTAASTANGAVGTSGQSASNSK